MNYTPKHLHEELTERAEQLLLLEKLVSISKKRAFGIVKLERRMLKTGLSEGFGHQPSDDVDNIVLPFL